MRRHAIVTLAILGFGLFTAPLIAVESEAEKNSANLPSLKPEPFPVAISSAKGNKLIADIDLRLDQIDRSQFDTDALLEKLAYDEFAVIRFVQENIAFEDYNGVLRGAEGALRSRAGNSIDQALLLAKLLKDIGADARIVEGVISRDELTKMALQKRVDQPGIFKKSDSATEVKAKPKQLPAFTVPKEVTTIASRLIKSLQDQDIELQAYRAAEKKEGVAYFWVEYRDTASGPWVAVHPAVLSEDAQQADVKPIKYYADSIDEGLQQRISVQAFIDRSWGGKLETVAVTKKYEYPAANLSSVTFSYSVMPDVEFGDADTEGKNAQDALSKAALFYPVFDFGSPKIDLAFDMAGNTLSAEDASSDKAAIFKTVGGKFGDVASALETGETERSADSKPLRYIARHWLEFTITQPGYEPRIITRDIARWQDGEDQFKQSLVRTARFRVEAGALAPAEFVDRNLRGAKKSIQIAMEKFASKDLHDKALQFSQDAELFLFTSDLIAREQKGEIIYRGAPAIVARYSPYGRVELGREGFDIISSPRTVISADTGQALPDSSITSGVLDTWLEYKLFAAEPWVRDSAFEKLRHQMQSDERLTLLSQSSSTGIGEIPDPGREIIQRDITNQALVLFPGEAKACDSWWRVDPMTGETLGILDNGWGGTQEYLIKLASIQGKMKIGAGALGCGTVIAFLRTSAFFTAWKVFQADEALGFQGMDPCSQLPGHFGALCTVVMAAAAVTGEFSLDTISTEQLMRICLRVLIL